VSDDVARLDVVHRRLGAADAGELLTLQRAAFVSEGRLHGTLDIPPLTETLEQLLGELATTITIGAYLGARLVAAARLTVDGAVGWISRVAVAPDLQGRGIGSALLSATEAAAPTEVREFRLGAAEKSHGNREMYARRGYRAVSEMVDRAGITLVVMAKERTPARP
jgi:GNAT superfamily N-acetyltransferase